MLPTAILENMIISQTVARVQVLRFMGHNSMMKNRKKKKRRGTHRKKLNLVQNRRTILRKPRKKEK